MIFIMTKAPTIEDVLVKDFRNYLVEVRFGEQYQNHKNLNVSNDHPFERVLDNQGDAPDLFPSITILSSNDGEAPGMGKNWAMQTLEDGELDDVDPMEWYMADTSLATLKTTLHAKGKVFGIAHSTVWRDSASLEIWSENIGVKNDLYNLARAYLTGPKMIELHKATGIVVHSGQIQGQRSGYYNYDFGRTLYGGRLGFQVDYPVLQAVYDTDVAELTEIQHTYREVLNG